MNQKDITKQIVMRLNSARLLAALAEVEHDKESLRTYDYAVRCLTGLLEDLGLAEMVSYSESTCSSYGKAVTYQRAVLVE